MPHRPASARGDEPPAGTGLTGTDLAGTGLTGTDLAGTGLTGTDLAGTDLAARNLTTTDLAGTDLAARLSAAGELTAEDIMALARLDDGPCAGFGADSGSCGFANSNPGAGGDRCQDDPRSDLDGKPSPEPPMPPDDDLALLDDGAEAPRVTEVLDAGFTHHIPTPGATGFASGGPLDVMLAGSDLAWHAAQVRRRGLAALSDSELCGIMAAARRLESWAAGLKLATVNELDVRRAGAGSRPSEHVADEVAAVLTLTPRAAGGMVGLTRNLARVPQTRAMLSAGILDQDRAGVIADALAVLDPAGAAAVENLITPTGGEKTTGQLRAACERAIKAYDPQAATRRREQAQKDARVECWAEAAGTSAIAGRDLSPAGVIAADKTLDADARWLGRHGHARQPR